MFSMILWVGQGPSSAPIPPRHHGNLIFFNDWSVFAVALVTSHLPKNYENGCAVNDLGNWAGALVTGQLHKN